MGWRPGMEGGDRVNQSVVKDGERSEMAIPLKYNVRTLMVRRVSTAMTAVGLRWWCAVFVIVMAMVAGLNSAISDTGDRASVVIRRSPPLRLTC